MGGGHNCKVQVVWLGSPSIQYLYQDASHIQQLDVQIWHTGF